MSEVSSRVVSEVRWIGVAAAMVVMCAAARSQVLVNDGATPVVTDWRLAVLVLRDGALPSSAASPPPPS